jgi:hypothetical protein
MIIIFRQTTAGECEPHHGGAADVTARLITAVMDEPDAAQPRSKS